MEDKTALLKRYFGHSAFRPGQEEVIGALMAGRDALGVMPTGAGKSVCYQIPALALPGAAIVVSPLISLMKDQVAALTQAGIPAAFVNSSLTPAQCRAVYARGEEGRYKIIYAAPERLETPDFLRFAQSVPVSLLAVDEAHCVSQWGQDFRPSYLRIPAFLEELPARPALGAFTATATARVKEDIVRLLGLRDPVRVTTGFDRPNLYLEVLRPKNKAARLVSYLEERRGRCGIVYCATRKAVESVCEGLRDRGFSATRYHAGLPDEERRQNQEDFIYDRARIMVATNAFGMGIDKSNVSFVVHYHMPKDLESYYQEAGRAGRDGSPADCALLYSPGDVQTAKYLIRSSQEGEELTQEEREEVQRRDLERLEEMVGYCKTRDCLRGYILRYFGEEAPDRCGSCGSCQAAYVQRDITTEAQKILSGVARVEKKLGYGLGAAAVLGMLRGSRNQRVLELGLDKLSTYGVMKDLDRRVIREYMDELEAQGYLELTKGEYPVLRLTPRSGEVLFRGAAVSIPVRAEEEREAGEAPERSKKRPAPSGASPADQGLEAALKALRSRLAQEAGVPAYIIFTNAALTDMAARRPRTLAEFLEVSGVGEKKAARYGEVFLAAIREYEG